MPKSATRNGKQRGLCNLVLYCCHSLTDTHRKRYHEIKSEWCGVPEVFDRPDVLEERHRIDVDCRRTDRTHPLFCTVSSGEAQDSQYFSIISPLSDIGAQSPSNEHIDRMGGVLLTYNFYDKDLGKPTYTPLYCHVSTARKCRVCTRHVRSLRAAVRGNGHRGGVNVLVLRGSNAPHGMFSRKLAKLDHIFSIGPELPP